MDVQARSDVLTALDWGLDEEPGADDVSCVPGADPDYIAKLLFGPQLVKSGLIQELIGKTVK